MVPRKEIFMEIGEIFNPNRILESEYITLEINA